MSVLQISNLTKKYDTFVALNSINLTIEKGSIYGFLGPNGAGKTTTIKIITNLSIPTSGEFSYFGTKFSDKEIKLLDKIGVMYSEPALEDYFTALETLIYFGKIYGLDKETTNKRAVVMCQWLGLDINDDKLVIKFSAGMKKKLGFLTALIHKPDLLILDEPFESVDPATVKTMKKIMLEFAKSGGTILISSHVLSHLESLITHLAIINKGTLVLDGNYNQIQNELKNLQQKTDLESIFLSSIGETEEKEIIFPW